MWCLPQQIFLAQISLNENEELLGVATAPPVKKGEAMLAVATDQALAKAASRKGAAMGFHARSCPRHHQLMKGGIRILGLPVSTGFHTLGTIP